MQSVVCHFVANLLLKKPEATCARHYNRCKQAPSRDLHERHRQLMG